MAERLQNFEPRASQVRMAGAVLEAIEGKRTLCVEAGTGTGKTLAYLIPSLLSGRKTLVSTATRNLQDQLVSKDIPFLQQHLFPDLKVVCMKGRQNYICLKRLQEEKVQWLPLTSGQARPELLYSWAAQSESGDRAELDWLSDNDALWSAVDARSEICIGQKCAHYDRCFITRMRRQAFEADLVVVNHALFFANLALESDELGRVLPDFAVLILDEAHEVEDIAADHFGSRLSNYQFAEFTRDFQAAFRNSPQLNEPSLRLHQAADALFDEFPGGEGRHSLNFYRTQHGEELDLRDLMLDKYNRLRDRAVLLTSQMELVKDPPEQFEPLSRRLQSLTSALDEIFLMNEPDLVYWFEKRRRGGVFVHVTPTRIQDVMRKRLYTRCDTTILTSATLTTDGSFEYLRSRLGMDGAEELIVPGEFDYASQSILYVPSDIPEPSASPAYLEASVRQMRELLAITEGDAFLLFTSFFQMERAYQALAFDLPYPLLRQGEMPRNRLLEVFRETPGSVLCGTSSFWQGVDVRGEALKAVIIDKLPFQVPTEPVIAARLHQLKEAGKNGFVEYSVPNAVITLKQGLGRLIRSREDRGILAVLDVRLRRRRYGPLFLRSLPNCPVTDKIEELRNFFRRPASPATEGT